MTAATPQPAASQVIDGVNDLRKEGRVFPEGGLEIRRLLRSADQLVRVNPAMGWMARGCVLSLTGSVDDTDAAFANAAKLASNADESREVRLNWTISRQILGQYLKARELLVNLMKPESGLSSPFVMTAVMTGNIRTAAESVDRWSEMGQEIDRDLAERTRVAARVLGTAGIADDDVIQQLEIAARVLLKHGLMTVPNVDKPALGEEFRALDVPGEFQGVVYALRVNQSPSATFDLNVELVEAREARGVPTNPALTIAFVPA